MTLRITLPSHAGLRFGENSPADKCGYDPGEPAGEPEATLAAMDVDGDGRVSFREFVGWFEGLCAASDEAA